MINIKTEKSYRLIINDDKCANGRRLEFLPSKKDHKAEKKEELEEEGKYHYFITTGCTLLKQLEGEEGKKKKSYVDNGCVKKFKVNEEVFLELAKLDK